MSHFLQLQSLLEGSNFVESNSSLRKLLFDKPYALVETPQRVELKDLSQPHTSIYVDFVSGTLGYRRLHGGGNGQAVAKAVLSRSKNPLTVFDATAGMGKDAFVLASLGCYVTMFERNPIVRILLSDGLKRAYDDEKVGTLLKEHLCLSPYCSIMDVPDEKICDVVYLDPMFPARDGSAMVKKDMRIFHDIVGPDADSDLLLTKALKLARYRVSVKRPKGAPYLNGIATANRIASKNIRFDLYCPN